ncbi:MAG: MG2 domain-containing protein, partial [Ramlibacter sp.]
MRKILRTAAAGILPLAVFSAQAVQITSLTPQGEVARVRQVVAKFDESAVNFGDPKAPAPLALTCSDAQATRGTSRWTSDREWVFEFENDLPPGVTCSLQLRAGFKTPKGGELAAGAGYKFNTGGPFVQQIQPGTYQRIDEEQFFMLQLNGPATPQSVRDNLWCSVEGLGERVPVRPLEAKDRADYLKSLRVDKASEKEPLRFVTFACNRRMAPNAKIQIVYGKGIATPSGVANTVERRFNFQVREPFSASFSCERENAQAACLPVRPMTLSFNAPVSRKLAAQIVLKSAAQSLKPAFDKEEGGDDTVVNAIAFKGLLPERTEFTIELPKDFKDASGRALANAASFPLKVSTTAMPPLAKFAAAPFGIVERFAEPEGGPMLPVTLRSVEPGLQARVYAPGQVREIQPQNDAEIISWFRKVQRYDSFTVPRALAAVDVKGPLPNVLEASDKEYVQGRMVSLLNGQAAVKTMDLPKPANNDPRPFEVVGIPLSPGFHVLEIASQVLGDSLLDARHGKPRTMYVRTSALVTNLGVHFKLGRENALAWVTTLDKGQPVANATVRVSDCSGKELATGVTNAQGIADIKGLNPQAPNCAGANDEEEGRAAYFVSARARDAQGTQDIAFTWSDWYRGIEPWRYNVPTSREARPDERAHTVFDRTLLRAGETVSMKHVMRTETRGGFSLPTSLPDALVVTHIGSGQQFTQPLAWRKTATGGQSAESTFAIPPAAKLGQYQVELKTGSTERPAITSGQFRVEEFRLPVLEGRVGPSQKDALVNVKSVPAEVQINYVSGGPAVGLPVRVSALVRAKALTFRDFDEFSFAPPRGKREGGTEGEEEAAASQDQRVVADKLPATLDRAGLGKVAVAELPPSRQPQELLMEATYADPNGEVQTIRSVSTLWPAAVVAGIKTEGWVSSSQQIRFQALALDLSGKAAVGVPLSVKAMARVVTTSRKRMVGGFYTHDNKTEVKDLGEVCSGKSDSRGLLLCEAKLGEPGEVELVATATDTQGNIARAAGSVWVTRQGELWFGGENHDRIDVLPEKKAYQPGETARLQVRMPFRFATALVTVEREGIVESQVVQLNGSDPTVSLPIKEGWGPNVYVSVLTLRGRLREVPWYSFFTWGFKAPGEWWTAFWYEGREYVAPTALVDLSKPAFRLGLAELRVGIKAHQLDVAVKSDKESYPVRGQAKVTVTAKLPNGQPAANAEVALAAVDQALLELMPNASWNLL